MARNEVSEWMEIATATMTLAMESAAVVGLRAVKAAKGGPSAADEAWRMYAEKVTALAELQTRLLMGTLGMTPAAAARGSLRHYRRKVRDNRRRLGRS
jgi:hypothetical protein